MITLITGVPGSGKTLYTLWHLLERVEAENRELLKQGRELRQVFTNGVKGLNGPVADWQALDDPKKWMDCPTGSIIVIDECQTVFRPRGAGSHVPEYIAALETHRHHGLDIYLITQHPMLVDQNIRRLVGRHFHVVRKFGMQRAVVHEWGSTHEITQRNLLSAQRHQFSFPREVFDYYQSSEMHTHKAKIPKRVWFLLATPLIIGALVWFAWTKMQDVGHGVQSGAVASSFAPVSENKAAAVVRASEGPEAYIASYTPRLPGMPWTAPAYDEVTRPTEAPYPVACLKSGKACRCYDQQENRIAVTEGFCSDFIERGMFVAWKAQKQELDRVPDEKRRNKRDEPVLTGG